MAGILECELHGAIRPTCTSPVLAEAVRQNRNNALGNLEESICPLIIYEYGRHQIYWVDEIFLYRFVSKSSKVPVLLIDRSIVEKKLNDRLLIRKIFSEMESVCPGCLRDVVLKYRQQNKERL